MKNNPIQRLNAVDPPIRVPEEIELEIHRILRQDILDKKERLLEINEVCNRVWFIEKGLFRSFWKVRGREQNVWFMSENDLMFDAQSFYRGDPSRHVIEALEKSIVYSISKIQLEAIYKRSHDFEHIGRLITQEYYLKFLDNWEELTLGTVKDRYHHFLKAYPGLDKRIPIHHIASFLKCAVRSLHRVRESKM